MAYKGRIEYAANRKMRERNTRIYRLLHWPIWIWVFFLAPGPLTFSLFARGFNRWNALWLTLVLAGTGIAGLYAQLPGVEPRPYILRFDEDKPNPLYRRVCYTFAWSAIVTFATLNLAGLIGAAFTGIWQLKQIYQYAYSPFCAFILLLGILGKLPRAGPSTKGEGTDRRYFYGSIWAVTAAQTVLLILWKSSNTLDHTRDGDVIMLAAYIGVLILMGMLASRGILPRTRPILPGELMISD